MGRFDPATLNAADRDGPIEIAERVWWVGRHLPGDPFQCHAYLIEHGDQSVLLDPGGPLVLDTVLEKVAQVVPFDAVRWFVCHHQDPDITAGLPRIGTMVTRSDAAIVTHWRAHALIRHYGVDLPTYLVDQHDWSLDLGGRRLRFVFTPYLHFPGAFTTFDEQTGALFSSDLFGGFTEQWRLVAEDLSYFEAIRPFHEHYMPSREILAAGMRTLERLPITMIAPQHGEILPEPLVQPVIDRLKDLDCGLYLMVHEDTDIQRLSEVHRVLHDAVEQIMISRDFREVATSLGALIRQVLPTDTLEFWARDGSAMIHFAPENRYRGTPGSIPPEWADLLEATRPDDPTALPVRYTADDRTAAIPLFAHHTPRATAVAVLRLDEPHEFDEASIAALSEVSTPLEVAMERELLLRSVENRRHELYEMAMHDALTGLNNRMYLNGATSRLFALHDRRAVAGIAVTMFDLDHFKRINDRHGHPAGDEVLRRFGAMLDAAARAADIVVRYGGEEFLAVQVVEEGQAPDRFARRVRALLLETEFDGPLHGERPTVSAGVARRRRGEDLADVVARADRALYRAKHRGRDRVVIAADMG